MAAQQGFVYEENACAFLKPMGFVPEKFEPAGAGHNRPDLELLVRGEISWCELKITAASAGQLVLKYDQKDKNNPWKFNDIVKDDREKQFIVDLAKEMKLFDRIKSEWKEVPFKRERDAEWKKSIGKLMPKVRYERDKNTFKDIQGEIPASKIEDYYNHKDTYYVNVGTHGFYLLGQKNPLGLKGVPRFGTDAKATYRARVQDKGSGNYQFTFEMQFSITKKSPFNIAPVNGKTVDIIASQVKLDCLIK